eukprot:gene2349-1478_t
MQPLSPRLASARVLLFALIARCFKNPLHSLNTQRATAPCIVVLLQDLFFVLLFLLF